LDEKEIARAAVESVAENTVDAVIAPALWAAAAGPCGALGYRATNTLDAMVGHRSARYERYGWASARLDDVAGWVPARVTAGLVAAVRPGAAVAVMRAVRRDAPAHPSPNAGVAEAAFAAALGLRLGGTNRYGDLVELRPPLGTGRPPEWPDIARAVQLSADVGLALAAVLTITGAVGQMRFARGPQATAAGLMRFARGPQATAAGLTAVGAAGSFHFVPRLRFVPRNEKSTWAFAPNRGTKRKRGTVLTASAKRATAVGQMRFGRGPWATAAARLRFARGPRATTAGAAARLRFAGGTLATAARLRFAGGTLATGPLGGGRG
jgi:hypothetical protein